MIDKEKYGILPLYAQMIVGIIHLDEWANDNRKGTRHTSITQIERIMCQLIDNVHVPAIKQNIDDLVSLDVLIKRDLNDFRHITAPLYQLNHDISADEIKRKIVEWFPSSESALRIKKQGGSDNDK